jgi:MFS transporter, FSR family, fosmidomycin resistance protein
MTSVLSSPDGAARDAGQAVRLLSLGHAVDDIYQGAVPALIPFFVAARHWDYAAASGITVAATALSSVAQPIFGMLTDRRRRPWLVPAGMSMAGAGIGLSGLDRSYLLTWLAIAASGLGVAAYHPESARLARIAARGSHVAMSWFAMGGNIGFALGPVLFATVLSAIGTGGTLPLAIPALACAALTGLVLRSATWAGQSVPSPTADLPSSADWAGFAKLTSAVVARSVVTFGLGTFLALFVAHRLGAGTGVGEAALVVFYAVGAGATLLGGRLATRYGRIRTARASYLLGIPCLACVWLVSGPAVFAAVAAAAVVLYVSVLPACHPRPGLPARPGRHGQRGHPRPGGQRWRPGRTTAGHHRRPCRPAHRDRRPHPDASSLRAAGPHHERAQGQHGQMKDRQT